MISLLRLSQACGHDVTFGRAVGRQIYPDAHDWDIAGDDATLPDEVVLTILLVDHLVSRHVLTQAKAYEVMIALRDDVTRYAGELRQGVDKYLLAADDDPSSFIKFVALEVLGDRFVRFGLTPEIFDLRVQRRIPYKDLFEGEGGICFAWSHSVFPAGLYLALRAPEIFDAQKCDPQADSEP